MEQRHGVFDVLEGTTPTGIFPLNENHWSNALAWLLNRRMNPTAANFLLTALAKLGRIEIIPTGNWEVERETQCSDINRRRIDVRLRFQTGPRWLIEIKVDPSYQDQRQIADEAAGLGTGDFLIILGPVALNDVSSELKEVIDGDVRIRLVSWRELAGECERALDDASLNPIARCLLDGISHYWQRDSGPTFDRMVKEIIGANSWTTFWPDDFEETFVESFPDVWGQWVCERGLSGQGNAHQYLLQVLRGMARRKAGFRLDLTGESRCPRDPKWGKWGFSLIYQYRVISPKPTDPVLSR